MKLFFVISLIFLIAFLAMQFFAMRSSRKTETQDYELLRTGQDFEVRYYPAALLAKVSSESKSYRELSSSGFGKLAGYLFGANSESIKMSMTAPVYMDLGERESSMMFVMPSQFNIQTIPVPDNANIVLETSKPAYVAVSSFGGFAGAEIIERHKKRLELLLLANGIVAEGRYRFLGYNPPYQLFGRHNEIAVELNPKSLRTVNDQSKSSSVQPN